MNKRISSKPEKKKSQQKKWWNKDFCQLNEKKNLANWNEHVKYTSQLMIFK